MNRDFSILKFPVAVSLSMVAGGAIAIALDNPEYLGAVGTYRHLRSRLVMLLSKNPKDSLDSGVRS
ncbi:MAG: hypothetical protein KME06_05200 [Kastovskya adunca ATA6-11-RM4]|jgi:hypothetical protein|nr:hypothetical protein [Kastovskya adunca ATA6-11-RM4]